jgi:hypothetical protein
MKKENRSSIKLAASKQPTATLTAIEAALIRDFRLLPASDQRSIIGFFGLRVARALKESARESGNHLRLVK